MIIHQKHSYIIIVDHLVLPYFSQTLIGDYSMNFDPLYFSADFIPVIWGNSLNAQSYAKEFYDGYQTKSVMIAKEELWTTKHSQLIDFVEETEILDDLKKIIQFTDKKLLIVSTNDAGVEALIELSEKQMLPEQCFVFYPDMNDFSQLTLKGDFARLCSELGIPHPLTIEVDMEQEPDLSSILLDGALWVKPSHRSEWQQSNMKQQYKACRVENIDEAQKVLQQISESDFDGTCIVQEEIPGSDDQLVSIDIFCDNGKAIVVSSGRKLMEQKGTNTIGNALSILSGNVPLSALEDAVRLLEYVNWNGWCNIDGKIDERSGRVVFFEANPRLGRSHYYITASGYNAVSPYVQKLREEPVEQPLFIENTLFSTIPASYVVEQLIQPEIIETVNEEILNNRIYNPLYSYDDSSEKRCSVIDNMMFEQWWQN